MKFANIVEIAQFTDMGNAIRLTFRTTGIPPSGLVEAYKNQQLPTIYETIEDIVLPAKVAEHLLAELQSTCSSLIKPSTLKGI